MPTLGAKVQSRLLHLNHVDRKWGKFGSPKDNCSAIIRSIKRHNGREGTNAG